MTRKSIEIQDLLAWTYQDEMPKLEVFLEAHVGSEPSASSSTWDTIQRLAVLGCRVDTSGRAPDDRALVYPDPDAMIVDEAVQALVRKDITMPRGWDGLCDCIGLTDDERREAHQDGFAIAIPKGDRLAAMVRRLAVTGRTPSWRDHGPIYRRKVMGANGKPAWFRMLDVSEGEGRPTLRREVDGYNRTRQRPFPGAYHKHYLDPSPSILVSERIDYQAWALALHSLAAELERRLARFFVLPCRVPLWPWEGEDAPRASRVLVAITAPVACEKAREGA